MTGSSRLAHCELAVMLSDSLCAVVSLLNFIGFFAPVGLHLDNTSMLLSHTSQGLLSR